MKRLFHITVVAALVALVTGCGGARRYDARLVAADSLMWTAPDSALAIVTAIDSLTGERDLAYRDLLMTQARYKCYADITASDDSAITRAIDYYRAHSSQREKLTRAYLYKGAVMEELAHIDSAMYYYKTAELNADPKDYTNLGQINTRIGALYQWYYVNTQICFDKFQKALEYYRHTSNKRLQVACLFNMAGCRGVTPKGNAEQLLSEATQLAIELNDSTYYFLCQELLCRQLTYYGDSIARAKQIALHCLNNYQRYVNHDLLLDLADIYVNIGKPDSAKYYLDMVTESVEIANLEQVKTRRFQILSDISKLEGDTALGSHYDMLSHQVSDSILDSEQRYQIQEIENEFNNRQNKSIQSRIDNLHWKILSLISIALAVSMLAFYFYYHKHRYNRIIKGIKQQSANQLNDLSILNDNIENLKIRDNQLKGFITSHLALMREMIEACYHSPQSKLTEQVKKIVQFQHDNEQKWTQLYHYIDAEYNNLISKTRDNYPQLNDKDLMLIALTSIGFSYIQIAIIMGYSNATSVSTIKQRLAQKMHLDGSLNDYINSIVGA